MSWVEILLYILAAVSLIVGLLLSNAGSTGGLTNPIGQDLELFKKTKDRGITKVLQILMFIFMTLFILFGLIARFVIIPATAA